MLPRIIKLLLVMAGFMLAAGISTYLTVHLLIRSEDTVVVPELTGKEVVFALELLSDLGLNTKVRASDYSNAVPRHHVISQDPQAGSEIKKGRDVRLFISKGARTVVIPNLAGVGLSQIPIYLEQNGLQLGSLSHIHARTRPKEEVLAQYPPAGVTALRGDRVDLLVSEGPATVWMAMTDLKGLSLGQAIEAIEVHHLVVNAIRTVNHPGQANDTVVDHSPASGYPIESGHGVDLTINRIQSGRIQSGVIQPLGRAPSARMAEWFRYSVEQGFLNIHLRVRVNRPDMAVDVFNAFVKPGSQIWLLIPKDQPFTLLVYVDDELTETTYYD